MWVGLLGPLLIRDDAAELPAGAAKQRVVLAALGLRPGRVVSVAELCGISWDDAPPPTASVPVRNHVKRLRRVLGPGYLLEAIPVTPIRPQANHSGPGMPGSGRWTSSMNSSTPTRPNCAPSYPAAVPRKAPDLPRHQVVTGLSRHAGIVRHAVPGCRAGAARTGASAIPLTVRYERKSRCHRKKAHKDCASF
jgi:hypothetical protein